MTSLSPSFEHVPGLDVKEALGGCSNLVTLKVIRIVVDMTGRRLT